MKKIYIGLLASISVAIFSCDSANTSAQKAEDQLNEAAAKVDDAVSTLGDSLKSGLDLISHISQKRN